MIAYHRNLPVLTHSFPSRRLSYLRARAPSNRADPDCRAPVMVAWGAGVDSTALIIELAEAGEPIDMVLFADTGSEKAETYAYLPIFRAWMDSRGIPNAEIGRTHV